jgi:hypothetical protein
VERKCSSPLQAGQLEKYFYKNQMSIANCY